MLLHRNRTGFRGVLVATMMLLGPGRSGRGPGGVVWYLVSTCLLSVLLLDPPEVRGSYSLQSGECKGRGKECTGEARACQKPGLHEDKVHVCVQVLVLVQDEGALRDSCWLG